MGTDLVRMYLVSMKEWKLQGGLMAQLWRANEKVLTWKDDEMEHARAERIVELHLVLMSRDCLTDELSMDSRKVNEKV